jgi:hypothetical protein
MPHGTRIWDASSNLVFDSPTAIGGVPVGFYSGGAGTVSFPQFAGFTMQALLISGGGTVDGTGSGVSISHTLGYPVATFQSWAGRFMLAIF